MDASRIFETDGREAWQRLAVALALSTVGGIGLWSTVVVLPAIQSEFGIDRGAASLPYMATLLGFAAGGILMGRIVDRFGVIRPLLMSAAMLASGYALSALATGFWQFVIIQALLVGMLGSSVSFAPLVADISHWFRRRRGIAVAIVASGNYLSGTIWPPLVQAGVEAHGWRTTHLIIALVCILVMPPLAWMLRRRAPLDDAPVRAPSRPGRAPLAPGTLQALLVFAGIACCVAMSMPQVHMVAYCADLGYGPARGAEMLSLMLGLGVVSRLASGAIADRIGGLGTLLLGSSLQCLALFLYLPFDGLVSLYVVSAVFGLSQGGIVPSYALIVRDYFPAREAATRVSLVLMATVAGMALGGWLSGEIYDLTGGYHWAFLNGIAWNLLNIGIALWLLAHRLGWLARPVPG